jgi:hydroxyisourate hydrolase
MTLSTHVLDTARGQPAAGVPVRLESPDGRRLAEGVTDHDGRLRDWVPIEHWRAGGYRLVFDTAAYLDAGGFFPEVAVVFQVADPRQHYHVPLLLSPFGYTVYRGS